jgi:peptidoglycan-associated lipoprotein
MLSRLLPFLLLLLLIFQSCSYTEKIKDGRTAYERRQFYVATQMLEDEIESSSSLQEKSELSLLLAESHQRLGNLDKGANWFKQAYTWNNTEQNALLYARALKQNEKYTEAVSFFEEAGKLSNEPNKYRGEANSSRIASDWLSKSAENEYVIKRISINSGSRDYFPFPMDAGKIMFTSDRSQSMGADFYKTTGDKFSSLFTGNIYTGEVSRFDNGFSSEHNDGAMVVTKDRTMGVFVRCDDTEGGDQFCKLYYAILDGNIWTTPILVEFTTPEVNYSSPGFSDNGRLMIFAANYEGGQGGYDLYVSEFNNGGWQDPTPAGNLINSQYDEMSPYMDADTLYFASNQPGGMGGYDIYRTYLDAAGKWTPAQNLKAPLNSGADDFGFVVDLFGPFADTVIQKGYFTSNRKDGLGLDDIYYFEKVVRTPVEVEDTTDNTKPLFVISLNLVTQEKEFNTPDDPNSGIRFRKPIGSVGVQLISGTDTTYLKSDRTGTIRMNLDPEKKYEFIGSFPDYISSKIDVSTLNLPELQQDTTIEARLVLEKIYYNREIVLDNIYYDLDKADIRKDAEPTLDTLAELLLINKTLNIQLGSHTDCRGDLPYNQDLSQRRAKSAVDYLISKGVDAQRLTARGFGESQPAAPCVCARCTEDEHQLNRRTTFAILK